MFALQSQFLRLNQDQWKKKLKQKSFAASVVREDIFLSVDELGLDLTEHVQFVIDALSEKAEELGLKGEVSPSWLH